MEVKTTEEKKGTRLKHVRPLNLSFSLSKPEGGSVPLAACDCDNYSCNCDKSTYVCVADVDVDVDADVDACGIWG